MQGDGTEQPGDPDQPGVGGGGDKTASNLVPYVGPKGGTGWRNPVTDRKYYEKPGSANLSGEPREAVGCLVARVPEPLRGDILRFGESIPADDLAEGGLESDPHVTVKYGLTADDAASMFRRLGEHGLISLRPGPLKVFENADADVLWVEVLDTDEWQCLRGRVADIPCVDDGHGEYVPHLTVAYLKPGKGKDYEGRDIVSGRPVAVETLTYHAPDGVAHSMPVWPTEEQFEAALAGIGPVELSAKAGQPDKGSRPKRGNKPFAGPKAGSTEVKPLQSSPTRAGITTA